MTGQRSRDSSATVLRISKEIAPILEDHTAQFLHRPRYSGEQLIIWLEEQRSRVSTAERLPGAIRSFLADFENLDVRHQKAQLQAIWKSANVYRDERIELEFRG